MNYRLYILVRTDKKFSIGKLMVHAGHVSAHLAGKYKGVKIPYVSEWVCGTQTKIVLSVKDDEEIYDYLNIAKQLGIIAFYIPDAGFYEVEEGTVIMGGIFCTKEESKEIGLNKLPLFRGKCRIK